jgi:predicted choloylglycine hydrolase
MTKKATSAVVSLVACAVFMFSVPTPAEDQELVTPEIVENPEIKVLDTEGAGKLYQIGEHLVCVMEGTPAEMGFQHGRLLAKKIHHIAKEGYMARTLWQQGYTPEYVMAQSDRMEKHFAPGHVEEMKGIVEGLRAAGVSDVTYEDIRLGVTSAELQHYGPNAPPGCSNFACWGKWTTDGRLLHGRNLDWNVSGGAQDDAAILVRRPTGGIPFMMVGWAGSAGGVSGMSAKGITIGEMTSSSPDATFDGLPLHLVIRCVLERASNLQEAVDIVKEGPPTTGWNFVIGDARIPDARALEVDAKACEVYAPMDPKENESTGHWAIDDAVRRTNHPVGEAKLLKLAKLYTQRMGIEINDLKIAIPLLKRENTWQRYDWMGKQIQARPGAIDIKEALQVLCNGPVRNDDTLHSWVLDPANRVAYVAIAGNNPPVTATSRAFTRIELKSWFE